MERGRNYPQVRIALINPDINVLRRAPDELVLVVNTVPFFPGFGFTTPITRRVVNHANWSITWSGTATNGGRTYTWQVVQSIKYATAGMHMTADFIDDLGRSLHVQFDSLMSTWWSEFGETLSIGEGTWTFGGPWHPTDGAIQFLPLLYH